MKYFAKLPITSYANTMARNLMTRVALNRNIESYAPNFYSYTAKEHDRPDNLAFNYYDDPYSYWLIFAVNGITDPYYDYRLTDDDFKEFIISKYGSISNAMNMTIHYKNNWESDDSTITTAAYVAKTDEERHFWSPVIGYSGSLNGYERKQDDIIVSTNKILALTVANSYFTEGELVMANSSTKAVVAYSNTTSVGIKHIVGSFANGVVITGNTSAQTATVSLVTTVYDNIPDTLDVYFSPVSYYDYENSINEEKKKIVLLDSRFAPFAEKKFSALLNET